MRVTFLEDNFFHAVRLIQIQQGHLDGQQSLAAVLLLDSQEFSDTSFEEEVSLEYPLRKYAPEYFN